MSPELQMKMISFGTNAIIVFLVFYSIILHEISHAMVSNWLGDDTAKRMGRLSLNPYNYRNYKRDTGLCALAGPVTNLLLAILFALFFHLSPDNAYIQHVSLYVVFFNLMLAFFNLLPIPPLDGSKVLGIFLPDELYFRWTAQERKGMMILFLVLMVSSLLRLNLIGRLVLKPIILVMQLLGLQ